MSITILPNAIILTASLHDVVSIMARGAYRSLSTTSEVFLNCTTGTQIYSLSMHLKRTIVKEFTSRNIAT